MPRIITQNAIVENEVFTGWNDSTQDGLQINGQITVQVNNCLFHRKEQDPTLADELLSVVNGARAHVYRSSFGFSGKGVLVGSGNTNEEDYKKGQSVIFEECLFDSISRRSIMVNAGQALMKRCLIRNWGVPDYHHEKCFGTRVVSSYASMEVIDSIYEQEDFITCIKRGTLIQNVLRGGAFWQGIKVEEGTVYQRGNYKNHWWITGVENDMSEENAEILKGHLLDVCPKLP